MIEGSVVGTLVRLILSLATVLTLMFLLARYLRNRQLGTGLGIGGARRRKQAVSLEIVTRQGLSRASSLAVVRVAGQLLLLGVTESTVSVLRELEDTDEPELVPPVQDTYAPGQGPLAPSPLSRSPFSQNFFAQGPLGIRTAAESFVETLRQRTVRRG